MPAHQNKRSLGIHPLLYPTPTLLIATYDTNDTPNVMTAAWGGICNSDPLSLSVSIRSACWTHAAMNKRKAFTVNIPSENMVAGMDYVGMISGSKTDKFNVTGWTPVKAEKADAPYIAESPVIIECSLSKVIELGLHTMFIGEILDVKANENCLDTSGKFPDIEKVLPIIFDTGSKSYYGIGKKIAQGWSIGKTLLKKE